MNVNHVYLDGVLPAVDGVFGSPRADGAPVEMELSDFIGVDSQRPAADANFVSIRVVGERHSH